jgi:hypothetical protein
VAFSFAGCERVPIIDALRSNIPHTEDVLKENVHNAVSSFLPAELRRAINNMFARIDSCLQAEGNHFEHSLLNMAFISLIIIRVYNALNYNAWATACGKLELGRALHCLPSREAHSTFESSHALPFP